MIDLHAHTNFSDGTCSPAALIEQALATGLEALAISDHDTLAGYDEAVPVAAAAGLDLVCGIELSTKLRNNSGGRSRSVHLLGYFLLQPPSAPFRQWLLQMQESRRQRNRGLVERLQALGMEITLEEVQAVGGYLTGRPHFAKVLLQKGYVSSIQEAFDLYLADAAKAHVEREEPDLAEGIRQILRAGGLPSLAHPVRLDKNPEDLDELIRDLRDQGLGGIEVYHSDHSSEHTRSYLELSQRYRLAVTGGSDYHGETKPGIKLGTGKNGNLSIPIELLQQLRNG